MHPDQPVTILNGNINGTELQFAFLTSSEDPFLQQHLNHRNMALLTSFEEWGMGNPLMKAEYMIITINITKAQYSKPHP